jgi:alpha-D-ribose 1-methylphosphonate 5-triphosphate synthase subunit PhnH
MSYVTALSEIAPGLADPVLESQVVFRRALHALSRPGEIEEIECRAELPPGLHIAAGALLLVLLDQDTRLWLAPSMAAASVAAYFRFHTGCVVVEHEIDADVALIGTPQDLPRLAAFAIGSEEYPERSATIIVQVESLTSSGGWTLRGPGLAATSTLAPGGLDARFVREWTELQRLFPRGIDLFLASGNRLAGLPRTTRIEV